MKTKTYTFEGEKATVTWDSKRCIHFEACVHGLPKAFDATRRPWIDPDEAAPEALKGVIEQCPTGALHMRLADGTDPEEKPTQARVRVAPDGPLYVRGDVTVRTADGEVLLRDTRVALCRCGLSQNKPLCDNSHHGAFADPGRLPNPDPAREGDAPGPAVEVKVLPHGSVVLSGPFTVVGADGGEVTKEKAAFCRCGHSKNKPFCDRSHVEAGFHAP